MIGMLKMPLIWIMIFAVVICAISLSFFDPTLADHLASFNLSTTGVGLMFLLCGGVYTITAPIWGIIIDRWECCNSLMVFGSMATILSMLFVGPSPLFGMEKDLVVIGISLSVFGVAAGRSITFIQLIFFTGSLYIPTFQNCLNAVKEQGYEDNFETYGCVSGIFQSAFAFGAFLGPTLGGLSVQQLGFGWTTTFIAFINGIFIIMLCIFFGVRKLCNPLPEDGSNASSSPSRKKDRLPEV
jgi:MFS family permease